ncbi:hypothetical protein FQZ97_891630 [compost metagenome]
MVTPARVAPAQLFQDGKEHLKMIVLLIAYHPDRLVGPEIFKFQVGGAQVLCNVDRGTVTTQHQLMIQPLISEIYPDAVVFLFIKYALLQAFFHDVLSQQVGV